MSRKPPRVPPTLADKRARIVAVATEHVEPGGVYRLPVAHDEGCPALRTRSLRDCTCEPEVHPPERLT